MDKFIKSRNRQGHAVRCRGFVFAYDHLSGLYVVMGYDITKLIESSMIVRVYWLCLEFDVNGPLELTSTFTCYVANERQSRIEEYCVMPHGEKRYTGGTSLRVSY